MKVTLQNLGHCFGDNVVLDDINMEIQDGEFFTLLGPSGCGKTTILRIIAGFLKPTKGRVLLGGTDITGLPPEKRNIGTVFQNYALFPHLNVSENVRYGLELKGLSRKDLDDRLKSYLDLVGMYDYREKKISELSGGQQQRVAVARSLAIEPKILLLDEPMSNLDAALRDRMRDEIRALQQKLKITTLFITHDQKEALSISDKVAVMNGGNCIQQGTPFEVYGNPANEFVANFVGESNLIDSRDFENIPEFSNFGTARFLRPEALEINSQNRWRYSVCGFIDRTAFNGSTIEYHVLVGGKNIKLVELNDGKLCKKPGSRVYIGLRGDYNNENF
ncbi:MAG: ABC transporter ATP-binding protein [Proteocatella sp.]